MVFNVLNTFSSIETVQSPSGRGLGAILVVVPWCSKEYSNATNPKSIQQNKVKNINSFHTVVLLKICLFFSVKI
jgi:hypothetical protein